jgi:hypothetical protein
MGAETSLVEAEVVAREIGPAIDSALSEAAKVAASVVDDASRERAVSLGVLVREKVAKAEEWRECYYIPAYRAVKNLADFVDPKIKTGKGILKVLSSAISEYDIRKRREEQLEIERREAEARRKREEAERKIREAEEAEKRAREAEEAEKRRKQEAEEAERRRIQAEEDAKRRREEEARRLEQEERARKIKAEEDARLAHAQVADSVGAGEKKADAILETPTPISRVVASPQVSRDSESLGIESDLAKKAADEKAEAERIAAEESERRRIKAEEDARAAREAAATAAAAASAAEAAITSAGVLARRPDERERTVVRWRWDLAGGGTRDGDRRAFLALVAAVHAGRAPVEYLGFDQNHPEKFRPAAINDDVQRLKSQFSCDGLRVFMQEDKQFLIRKKEETWE